MKVGGKMRYFITIMIILILTSCSSPSNDINNDKVAHEGELHIQEIDLHKTMVQLNGEWEFYWNELLSPQEIENRSAEHYISFNQIWNNYDLNGEKLSGEGYATFRLTTTIGKNNKDTILGLYIPFIHTSYNIFIDGILLDSVGQVGTKKSETIPYYLPKVIYFTPKSEKIEIVFQIANFHHSKGGIPKPLILGEGQQITQYKEKRVASNLFLSGSFFIISIFHLSIFIYRRKEKGSLLFSIFSFLISIKMLINDQVYLVHIFPSFDWMLTIKIEYFVNYTGFLVFLLFLKTLYPKEINDKIYKFFVYSTVIFLVIYLFTPAKIYTALFNYYTFIGITMVFYFTYIMIIVAIRQKSEAIISSVAGIIFYYTILNDLLFNLKLIKGAGHTLAFGFLVFIFSYSLVLSIKYAKTFNKVDQLNIKLKALNESLEEKVLERTESLKRTMQKTAQALSEKSILEERARLLRDIHDTVGHILTTIIVQIEAGKRLITKDATQASERLNSAQNMVRSGLDEIRRLLQVLKSSDTSLNFTETMKNLIESTQFHTNVIIDDEIEINSPLSVEQQNVLFRALQEGLTNGIRHGKCTHFTFRLYEKDHHIHFLLQDDGIGANHVQFRLGLSAMKERVKELNGTIELISSDGDGFTIKITLPLRK